MIERFFGNADRPRKISHLSVSRSQRIEKSRNLAFSQIASALGKTNCFGSIARFESGYVASKPREFVQHLR